MSLDLATPEERAAAVDPRIRARREEVARDAGLRRLRRLRRLTIAAGIASAVLLVVALAFSPLLDVDRISVRGATRSGAAAVQRASGVSIGDALLRVDTGAAERGIEALPWVATASVDRHLPNGLTVAVTEREPVAVLVRGRRVVLVDATGRALDVVASAPLGLVAIEGVHVLPRPGQQVRSRALEAVDVAQRVGEHLGDDVRAVSVGEPLSLVLRDGAVVLLGSSDGLDGKLVAARTLLDQVDRWCLARLDVRVPGSPVLTRAPGCL